jgi:hypothetical protein
VPGENIHGGDIWMADSVIQEQVELTGETILEPGVIRLDIMVGTAWRN